MDDRMPGRRRAVHTAHAHRKVPRCVSERLRLTVKIQSPLRAASSELAIPNQEKRETYIDHDPTAGAWRHVEPQLATNGTIERRTTDVGTPGFHTVAALGLGDGETQGDARNHQ
jgi:hypothetical protein